MSMHTITIQVAFVPDETSAAMPDPALAEEVGRNVANKLTSQGYAIQPAYTGTRGGALFDVVFQTAQAIQDNKEFLMTLAGLAATIIPLYTQVRKERIDGDRGKDEQKTPPPSPITIVIDNNRTITPLPEEMESSDALLERLLQESVTTPITPQSNVSLRVSVASSSPRRRR